MARALKNPYELPFDSIERQFDLASMTFGRFQPAVWKKGSDEKPGYGIRILVSSAYNHRTQTTHTSWDYFYTDETGLIIQSPHGLGSKYNGRYRITGLDEAVKKYEKKVVNQ